MRTFYSGVLIMKVSLFLAFFSATVFAGVAVSNAADVDEKFSQGMVGDPAMAGQTFIFTVKGETPFVVASSPTHATYNMLDLEIDPSRQTDSIRAFLKAQGVDISKPFSAADLYNFRTIKNQLNRPDATGNCLDWVRHFLFPSINHLRQLEGTEFFETYEGVETWLSGITRKETDVNSLSDEAHGLGRMETAAANGATNFDPFLNKPEIAPPPTDVSRYVLDVTVNILNYVRSDSDFKDGGWDDSIQEMPKEPLQSGDVILLGFDLESGDDYHVFVYLGMDTEGKRIVFTKNGKDSVPPMFQYWSEMTDSYKKSGFSPRRADRAYRLTRDSK